MKILYLILTLLLMVPGLTTAEEDEQQTDEQQAAQDADDQAATEDRESKAAPSADNLREKKLSKAFEQFNPSEEISADTAVPFPTDI